MLLFRTNLGLKVKAESKKIPCLNSQSRMSGLHCLLLVSSHIRMTWSTRFLACLTERDKLARLLDDVPFGFEFYGSCALAHVCLDDFISLQFTYAAPARSLILRYGLGDDPLRQKRPNSQEELKAGSVDPDHTRGVIDLRISISIASDGWRDRFMIAESGRL